jgi:hypothetical protein
MQRVRRRWGLEEARALALALPVWAAPAFCSEVGTYTPQFGGVQLIVEYVRHFVLSWRSSRYEEDFLQL